MIETVKLGSTMEVKLSFLKPHYQGNEGLVQNNLRELERIARKI